MHVLFVNNLLNYTFLTIDCKGGIKSFLKYCIYELNAREFQQKRQSQAGNSGASFINCSIETVLLVIRSQFSNVLHVIQRNQHKYIIINSKLSWNCALHIKEHHSTSKSEFLKSCLGRPLRSNPDQTHLPCDFRRFPNTCSTTTLPQGKMFPPYILFIFW